MISGVKDYSLKTLMIINQLKIIEQKVIAHENAHKAAGGELTGPTHYQYKKGPDGRMYIVGGDVPIHIQKGRTPEETLKIAEKIRAAALAPMDPSPQDVKVAAMATMMEIQAKLEIYKEKSEENKNFLDIYA